jgi:hypothetical protein
MNFLESGVPNLRFSVMGAELVCAYCTQTSASFRLKAGLRYGWIDVHFPCEGHIKARILAALPDEFLEVSKIREIVPEILNRLKIQPNETYEATFFKPTHVIELAQPVNREGVTDRIETERKFIPPAK